MANDDTHPSFKFHQTLKSDVIGKAVIGDTHFILLKQYWSKDDIGYSLHVSPAALRFDPMMCFLMHLGFVMSACQFAPNRHCLVHSVDRDFDVKQFADHFNRAWQLMDEAQRDFGECGIFLEDLNTDRQNMKRPPFFADRASLRPELLRMYGDGHTAVSRQLIRQSEDEIFRYKLTWLATTEQQGWIIHYQPKNVTLPFELQVMIEFLRIPSFQDCPESDFKLCYWRPLKFRGEATASESNGDIVQRWFDAHAYCFHPGVRKFISAIEDMKKFNVEFLPLKETAENLNRKIMRIGKKPAAKTNRALNHINGSQYDVAISYASSECEYAKALAKIVENAGLKAFCAELHQDYLWGKNLVDAFDEIFRKRARYCVIFVSQTYKERLWTNFERKSAQARALQEKEEAYILPIQVDGAELEGLLPTVHYISLSEGIEQIGATLVKKIRAAAVMNSDG